MYMLRANQLPGWMKITILISGLLAVSCATVNAYFPSSAVEQAADRLIEQVLGEDGRMQTLPPAEESRRDGRQVSWSPGGQTGQMVVAILSMVSTDVYAVPPKGSLGDISRPATLHRTTGYRDSTVHLDISSSAITQIQSSMQRRHARLSKHYKAGAIGYDSDGLVAIRDMNAVSPEERGELTKLIVEENRDRDALYREIARANELSEWETQIRDTFSRRWAAKAPSGWYYQGRNGVWKKK